MLLFYMYQIFSSLRSHLHFFVHFFFTLMEYFFMDTLYLFVRPSVGLFVCLPVSLSAGLSVCLSVYLFICKPICTEATMTISNASRSTLESFLDAPLHLYKRVCPSVCPHVRPSVCPSVCPLALWKTHRKRRYELAGRSLLPACACLSFSH